MKLYVNRSSPYARKAVVAAFESGLAGRVETVLTDPWPDASALLGASAVGKVPCLVFDDGSVLGESTAICLYLFELAGRMENTAQRLAEAQRTSLAQGLIDAAYTTVIEARRPPDKQWEQWVERQQRTVGRVLGVVEVPPEGRFDVGDITLAAGLAYLDFRLPGIAWRTLRPALAHWLEVVSQRPSMAASAPAV